MIYITDADEACRSSEISVNLIIIMVFCRLFYSIQEILKLLHCLNFEQIIGQICYFHWTWRYNWNIVESDLKHHNIFVGVVLLHFRRLYIYRSDYINEIFIISFWKGKHSIKPHFRRLYISIWRYTLQTLMKLVGQEKYPSTWL
jgi:hypothetical protein